MQLSWLTIKFIRLEGIVRETVIGDVDLWMSMYSTRVISAGVPCLYQNKLTHNQVVCPTRDMAIQPYHTGAKFLCGEVEMMSKRAMSCSVLTPVSCN
jgi:hypothetical protein